MKRKKYSIIFLILLLIVFIMVFLISSLFKMIVFENKVKQMVEDIEVCFTGEYSYQGISDKYEGKIYIVEFSVINNSDEAVSIKIAEGIKSEKLRVPELGWDYEFGVARDSTEKIFARFFVDESIPEEELMSYISDFEFEYKFTFDGADDYYYGTVNKRTGKTGDGSLS